MTPHIPRLVLYGAASTALAGAVVASSLQTAPNFFAAAVAMGRSSGALMALANFMLFNVICFGIAFKAVFFGRLRSIEYEHLFERLWLFVTESLLALTIFRRDFSISFMLMYGTLLFLKCFHWITADRVDYMDQVPPPGPPKLFHIRAINIIILLTALDAILVGYCLEAISIEGVSSMVLFASEFMILLASINGTAARYIIGLIDLRRARGREDAPTWEAKSMYIFYVDLVVDFAKLLTYLAFFTVIFLHYGLPLHILRDVYMTLRSFLSRCGDLIRYRRATRDMDALYPDATVEEMERLGDKTCIICREELVVRQPGERSGDGGPNDTPKKLVCGHVFHFYCLRSWLERQQSCPTCRRDVLRPTAASTRSAARAAPPAAPAPGAHPQPPAPPAAATPAPNPQNPLDAAANAFRQNLEEYFPRRDAAQEPTAVPTSQPTGEPTTVPPSVQPSTEETNIQTGVWGGPIVPGRFFPTPLGAAPRLDGPGPSTRSAAAAQVRFKIPDRSALPTASTDPISLSTTDTFSTVSTLSPSSLDPISQHADLATTEDEEEGDAANVSPENARRQAADAAMRRFGLAPTGTNSSLSSSTTAVPPFAAFSPIGETPSPGSDYKGKGKAREESWDDPPAFMPFLSIPNGFQPLSPRPRPHTSLSPSIVNGSASPWSASGNDHRGTEVPGASALEERLWALREVDDVIFGLVGELTRLKSRWEAADQVIPPTNANGQHQPAASLDPMNLEKTQDKVVPSDPRDDRPRGANG